MVGKGAYKEDANIFCGCFRKQGADTQGEPAGKQRNKKGLEGTKVYKTPIRYDEAKLLQSDSDLLQQQCRESLCTL